VIAWVKLHLIVEGETELAFARSTLKPHLAAFSVSVHPFMLPTNRKLGADGGALTWDRFHYNVSRLLKQFDDKSDRFSTMIDWYKLDSHFPGLAEAAKLAKPADRVNVVAGKVQAHFNSTRLIPFFTLHEFETLLYCDLEKIQSRIIGSEKAIAQLQKEIAHFSGPEDINDGETTAPSKRLIAYVPRYENLKVKVGAPAAGAIGLEVLREKCLHFGRWLGRLEKLEQTL
jgi:hypothetical protein